MSLENIRLWPGMDGPVVNYISPPPDAARAGKPRKLCILGSTGSIGVNALKTLKPGFFKVHALAGARNIELLARQAMEFRPKKLAVLDAALANRLAQLLPSGYSPEIYFGSTGYEELARDEAADCVLCAQMGSAGLNGALAAALAGKTIALANKESLVLAGGLLRKICFASGASILPVDSEHYAFFQCVAGKGQLPEQFLLTASGGPFRGMSLTELQNATPSMALAHPNWRMGRKISVDSATLMNKGFEFIEAAQLFGLSPQNIAVLVHPQSIVHGLVRMHDNSILAQLATPDMKLPISACLYWPEMEEGAVTPLDLTSCGPLLFEKPDEDKFICLRLAKETCFYQPDAQWLAAGLNPAAIALAAANEVAVELFLQEKCGFCDIGKFVQDALQHLVYRKKAPLTIGREAATDPLQALAVIRRLEASARNHVLSLLETP